MKGLNAKKCEACGSNNCLALLGKVGTVLHFECVRCGARHIFDAVHKGNKKRDRKDRRIR